MISQYLQKKYQCADNAVMPVIMLEDELLVDSKEAKGLVATHRGSRNAPNTILFDEYCIICENYLT